MLRNWLEVDSTISDYNNIKIGDKIPVYEFNNDVLTSFQDVTYYPVFYDIEVIGILGIHGTPSDDPTYSFGEEWANEVNVCLSSDMNEFCIVVTEDQMFIKSLDGAKLIEEYPFAHVDSQTAVSMSTELEDSIANVELDEMVYFSGDNRYTIQIPASPRTAMQITLPVGTIRQARNYCWAISVKLIGEYLTDGINYTPEKICDIMQIGYDDGAYVPDCINALNDIYSISTTKKSELTPNEVYSALGSAGPCYTDWQHTEYGHGMTLCGYYGDSVANEYDIRLSDSNSGTYKWLTKAGQPSNKLGYKYTYGSNTYSWNATLVPD